MFLLCSYYGVGFVLSSLGLTKPKFYDSCVRVGVELRDMLWDLSE